MSAWQRRQKRDYTGGENLKALPEFVAANQVLMAMNCVLTGEGLLETRPGKARINTTSLGTGPVLSVFRYAKEGGDKWLVVQHGTSLYAAQWDGLGSVPSFGDAIKTELPEGEKLRGTVWKDNLILCSPSVDPFRFDGEDCTNLTGAPKLLTVKLYANRLWGIHATNINHLRFSGLEDYDSWDALDLIKVRDGDGDRLMGLSPQTGGLVLLKSRSIIPLYGSSRENIRVGEPLTQQIGAAAHDGIIDGGPVTEGGYSPGLFMGVDNWYAFTLSQVMPLADSHSPFLDLIPLGEEYLITEDGEPIVTEDGDAITVGSTRRDVFAGVDVKSQRYTFHFPNGYTVCIDGKYRAVTTWKGLNTYSFGTADARGDNGDLLIGDADNGIIYRLSPGTDDAGTAIETTIREAYTDEGTPYDKIWRLYQPDIQVLDVGEAYSIDVAWDTDFQELSGVQAILGTAEDPGLTGDYWDVAYWNENTRIETPYWLHEARGKYISYSIRTSNRIRYRGYVTKFRPAGTI